MKPYLLIPAYSGYEFAKEDLHNLLKSLELGAYQEYFRVLVLLDGCHRLFEHEFKSQYKDFEFHNHSGNPKNFVGNVNIGLRRAREEGVGALIVNQDCILPSKASFLACDIGTDDEIMLATNTIDLPNMSLEEVVGRLNQCSEGIVLESTPVQNLPGYKVAGYCFWLGARVLQEVGVLDEIFKASLDDDDLTARVLLAGFPVELAPAWVYHKGSHLEDNQMSRSGAYGVRDGSLGLHLTKFYQKWSIPPQIKHEDSIKWILANYKWDNSLPQMRVV